MKDDVCGRFDQSFNNLNNVFCSGTGSCSGDFGGPIICVEQNEAGKFEPVVRGLISHTNNCKSKPTVFVDVEKYKSWIDSSVRAIAAQGLVFYNYLQAKLNATDAFCYVLIILIKFIFK